MKKIDLYRIDNQSVGGDTQITSDQQPALTCPSLKPATSFFYAEVQEILHNRFKLSQQSLM